MKQFTITQIRLYNNQSGLALLDWKARMSNLSSLREFLIGITMLPALMNYFSKELVAWITKYFLHT